MSEVKGELNIIGDIAGEYEALDKLVKKMPKADWVIGVGDLIDRGPQSKEVVQRFMDEPNWTSVRGNHEDMLLSVYDGDGKYSFELWIGNGGITTVESYAGEIGALNKFFDKWKDGEEARSVFDFIRETIPEDHVEWMRETPLFLDLEHILITHAPIRRELEGVIGEDENLIDSILWNRGEPIRLESNKFQVFGHNHNYDEPDRHKPREEWKFTSVPKTWKHNGEDYAICIDTDRADILTGIHWPTGKVYQQEY